MQIDPKSVSVAEIQAAFQGVVAPRPIALASSMDATGAVNLSPFSFFNMFSTKPPILVFSPARRARNNTTKHTYENLLEVPEVVINTVSYEMVQQVSLASIEFGRGVDEFVKSGLTPVPSVVVKPPRVAESPASFECVVRQVIPLGYEGGAGNLVVCEVQLAHFRDDLFDAQGRIDPQKLDAVARMGSDYYCRAHGENIFEVPKPNDRSAIGIDQLPESIRTSSVFTGSDLAMLANVEQIPSPGKLPPDVDQALKKALALGTEAVHRLAQKSLQGKNVIVAWTILKALDTRL